MLIFDTNTGAQVSEIEDVRNQVIAAWQDAFAAEGKPPLDTDPETPAGQLIDSQTAAICQKDNELLFLVNQFNPRYAEGKWQDALAKIYFLERHPAVPSSTMLTCTGLARTTIPVSAQVRDENGYTWECTTTTRIDENGTALVPFTCTTAGPIEAKSNSINRICTTVSGWDTATNLEDATVGNEEETQAAFEARRYQSVALNSRSSIQSAYSRIASLKGVIFCCMRQNRTSAEQTIDGVKLKPHSVYTCVLGGDENEIAEALYNTVSAGCDYTGDIERLVVDPITNIKDRVRFSRPTSQTVSIKVSIRKNEYTPPNAEDAIKEAIYNNFYGLASEYVNNQPLLRVVGGDTLYASRFYLSLLNQGFNEILNLQVALSGDLTGSEDSGSEDSETANTNNTDDSSSSAGLQYQNVVTVPINVNPVLSTDNIFVVIEEDSEATTSSGSVSLEPTQE